MTIRVYLTVLIVIICISACNNNKIDAQLEGEWVKITEKSNAKTIFFKENHIGSNGELLRSPFSEEKTPFKYLVDKSNYPFKIYLIIKYHNRNTKVPMGIYKIENDRLMICYVISKKKTLYGKPVGSVEYVFPESFGKNCEEYKKI